MKVLALETSAKSVSVAVTEDGKVLASSYQNIGLTHSVTLMPLLDGMLKNAGLTLKDMDLLAVAAGPGSFTGLRIGVSALKGLAWAEDKPCCGVSTIIFRIPRPSFLKYTVFQGLTLPSVPTPRPQERLAGGPPSARRDTPHQYIVYHKKFFL